jgi:hypothetical protein
MKKKNLKIFAVSFVIIYAMISGLCFLKKQPLVFAYGYGFSQFFTLFILLGLLSFCLVFVMDNLERILQKIPSTMFSSPFSIYTYFIIASAFGLFVFTLFSGFAESGLPFFYYGCVTNSCIYLSSGYIVTFVVAVYFAYRFIKSRATKEKS